MKTATATATPARTIPGKYYQIRPTHGSKFIYLSNRRPALESFDISEATRATEFAFDFLNNELFGGLVERCVITLQSTKGSYGHCSVHKVWNDGTPINSKREINLNVDYLSIDPNHYLGTLIHEMVHAFNFQRSILDCNPTNQYHNKKFKAQAEAVGLVVTRSDRYGFAHTRVAVSNLDGVEPVAEVAIASLNLKTEWNQSAFDFQRGSKGRSFTPGEDTPTGPRGGKGGPTGKGSGSKLKLWTCGCTKVRVAVAHFDATCNGCGNDFEQA